MSIPITKLVLYEAITLYLLNKICLHIINLYKILYKNTYFYVFYDLNDQGDFKKNSQTGKDKIKNK